MIKHMALLCARCVQKLSPVHFLDRVSSPMVCACFQFPVFVAGVEVCRCRIVILFLILGQKVAKSSVV